MEKEYVFIGNAQNKTRDFINIITKENKQLKDQKETLIKYCKEELEITKQNIEVSKEDYNRQYFVGKKYVFEEMIKKLEEGAK